MEWIIQNKEWLFSGVLIAIPIAIISWLLTTNGKKQKGGKGSTNIQVGRDININNKEGNNDDE